MIDLLAGLAASPSPSAPTDPHANLHLTPWVVIAILVCAGLVFFLFLWAASRVTGPGHGDTTWR